jgi:hypothetical protein
VAAGVVTAPAAAGGSLLELDAVADEVGRSLVRKCVHKPRLREICISTHAQARAERHNAEITEGEAEEAWAAEGGSTANAEPALDESPS